MRQLLPLPLLVLALSLGVSHALWNEARTTARHAVRAEFSFLEEKAAQQIRERMLDYEDVLHSLRGLFAASSYVEREEFRDYCTGLNLERRYPLLQTVGFIQHVRQEEKIRHVERIRKERFPDYAIHPESNRDAYGPIVYIGPSDGRTRRTLGSDTYAEPTWRAAMEQARDTGQMALLGRVSLDSGRAAAPDAFLMLLSVSPNDAAPTGLGPERENQTGWVFAAFRGSEVMKDLLANLANTLNIEVYDENDASGSALIYDNDDRASAGDAPAAFFQSSRKLAVGNRLWTIRTNSLPGAEKHLMPDRPRLIAQGGVLVSALLSLLAWMVRLNQVRARRATRSLEQELNARRQAEASLRLAAMVYENSSEGMLVTDSENRIVAVNPAYTRITGYEPADVLGKHPNILNAEGHDPAFHRSLWKALDETGHWKGEIWDCRKNGEMHPSLLTINTVYDAVGNVYRRVALFLDISEKKQSEDFIWRQANFDALTRLPNRSMFHARLIQDVDKAKRTDRPLALIFIDLDRFKEVNDTLGHEVGDRLLAEAATRIAGCARELDTVARLGGDEFTVILPDLREPGSIERMAGTLLATLSEPYYLGDEIIHITASAGITLYPRDAGDAAGLIKNAEQAMYVAKNLGRNRFSYFTSALQEAAQARARLISDLRQAVATNQFSVHFQPIVDLASGEVYKAEALVRWTHPQRGFVSPSVFIPLAEETGLIGALGDGVFREAAREAKRLRTLHHPEFQISVNKSPRQFLENDAALDSWFACLHELGLPGNSITIEITEGLLLNAVADVTDKLRRCRNAGIQMAIDDFGTGYSSLAYLKRFHIDYLKIDQSFVRDIETDPNDLALSQAIIVMAHALGLKVIAEGVETLRQLEILRQAGCDYAQGYYFARPVPADAFVAWLRTPRPPWPAVQ